MSLGMVSSSNIDPKTGLQNTSLQKDTAVLPLIGVEDVALPAGAVNLGQTSSRPANIITNPIVEPEYSNRNPLDILGEEQSNWEQARNAIFRGIVSGTLTAAENVSYLLDPKAWVDSATFADRVTVNAFAEEMIKAKAKLQEAIPIYKTDNDGEGIDWSDGATFWEGLSSGIDSMIGFAVPGGIAAKGITSAMKSKAIASALLRPGTKEAISTIGTAFATNHVESTAMGAQTYMEIRDNLIQKGVNPVEAMEIASKRASQVRDFNKLMIAGDLFLASKVIGKFGQGTFKLKDKFENLKLGGTEFAQEAAQSGLQQGVGALAERDYVEGRSFYSERPLERSIDVVKEAFSHLGTEQTLYEGLIGFFAGPMQAKGMKAVADLSTRMQLGANGYKLYKKEQEDLYKEKEKLVNGYAEQLKKVESTQSAVEKLAKNPKLSEEERNAIMNASFDGVIMNSFRQGTHEYLARSLEELSQNPSATEAERANAVKMLERFNKVTDVYSDAQRYVKADKIMENTMRTEINENLIQFYNEKLKDTDKQFKAILSTLPTLTTEQKEALEKYYYDNDASALPKNIGAKAAIEAVANNRSRIKDYVEELAQMNQDLQVDNADFKARNLEFWEEAQEEERKKLEEAKNKHAAAIAAQKAAKAAQASAKASAKANNKNTATNTTSTSTPNATSTTEETEDSTDFNAVIGNDKVILKDSATGEIGIFEKEFAEEVIGNGYELSTKEEYEKQQKEKELAKQSAQSAQSAPSPSSTPSSIAVSATNAQQQVAPIITPEEEQNIKSSATIEFFNLAENPEKESITLADGQPVVLVPLTQDEQKALESSNGLQGYSYTPESFFVRVYTQDGKSIGLLAAYKDGKDTNLLKIRQKLFELAKLSNEEDKKVTTTIKRVNNSALNKFAIVEGETAPKAMKGRNLENTPHELVHRALSTVFQNNNQNRDKFPIIKLIKVNKRVVAINAVTGEEVNIGTIENYQNLIGKNKAVVGGFYILQPIKSDGQQTIYSASSLSTETKNGLIPSKVLDLFRRIAEVNIPNADLHTVAYDEFVRAIESFVLFSNYDLIPSHLKNQKGFFNVSDAAKLQEYLAKNPEQAALFANEDGSPKTSVFKYGKKGKQTDNDFVIVHTKAGEEGGIEVSVYDLTYKNFSFEKTQGPDVVAKNAEKVETIIQLLQYANASYKVGKENTLFNDNENDRIKELFPEGIKSYLYDILYTDMDLMYPDNPAISTFIARKSVEIDVSGADAINVPGNSVAQVVMTPVAAVPTTPIVSNTVETPEVKPGIRKLSDFLPKEIVEKYSELVDILERRVKSQLELNRLDELRNSTKDDGTAPGKFSAEHKKMNALIDDTTRFLHKNSVPKEIQDLIFKEYNNYYKELTKPESQKAVKVSDSNIDYEIGFYNFKEAQPPIILYYNENKELIGAETKGSPISIEPGSIAYTLNKQFKSNTLDSKYTVIGKPISEKAKEQSKETQASLAEGAGTSQKDLQNKEDLGISQKELAEKQNLAEKTDSSILDDILGISEEEKEEYERRKKKGTKSPILKNRNNFTYSKEETAPEELDSDKKVFKSSVEQVTPISIVDTNGEDQTLSIEFIESLASSLVATILSDASKENASLILQEKAKRLAPEIETLKANISDLKAEQKKIDKKDKAKKAEFKKLIEKEKEKLHKLQDQLSSISSNEIKSLIEELLKEGKLTRNSRLAALEKALKNGVITQAQYEEGVYKTELFYDTFRVVEANIPIISIWTKTMFQKTGIGNVIAIEKEFEEGDENDAILQEQQETRDNYDEDWSYKLNYKDKTSFRLKVFLSNIRQMTVKEVLNEEGNVVGREYVPIKSPFRLKNAKGESFAYMNFSEVFDTVRRALSDVPITASINDITEILDEAAISSPFLYDVIQKLKEAPEDVKAEFSRWMISSKLQFIHIEFSISKSKDRFYKVKQTNDTNRFFDITENIYNSALIGPNVVMLGQEKEISIDEEGNETTRYGDSVLSTEATLNLVKYIIQKIKMIVEPSTITLDSFTDKGIIAGLSYNNITFVKNNQERVKVQNRVHLAKLILEENDKSLTTASNSNWESYIIDNSTNAPISKSKLEADSLAIRSFINKLLSQNESRKVRYTELLKMLNIKLSDSVFALGTTSFKVRKENDVIVYNDIYHYLDETVVKELEKLLINKVKYSKDDTLTFLNAVKNLPIDYKFEKGVAAKLAEVENRFGTKQHSANIRAGNDAYYGYVFTNHLRDTYARLTAYIKHKDKNVDKIKEEFKNLIEILSSNGFSQDSLIIQDLKILAGFDTPGVSKKEIDEVKKLGLEGVFNLVEIAPGALRKQNGKFYDRYSLKNININDLAVMGVEFFAKGVTQNGDKDSESVAAYLMPPISDTSHRYVMVSRKRKFIKDETGTYKTDENYQYVFNHTVVPELRRIVETYDTIKAEVENDNTVQNKDAEISRRFKNADGSKFYFLYTLNNLPVEEYVEIYRQITQRVDNKENIFETANEVAEYSPITSMFKAYIESEIKQNLDLLNTAKAKINIKRNYEKIVPEYVLNSMIANVNMFQIYFGDPSHYEWKKGSASKILLALEEKETDLSKKGAIKKLRIKKEYETTKDNLVKRLKQVHSPGSHLSANNAPFNYKALVFKSIEDNDRDRTDSQEYITESHHIEIAYREGKIPQDLYNAYLKEYEAYKENMSKRTFNSFEQRLEAHKTLFAPVKKAMSRLNIDYNPEKFVQTGYEKNSSTPVFIKTSSIVLSDEYVANNPTLSTLKTLLEITDTGRAAASSGVKASSLGKNTLEIRKVNPETKAKEYKSLEELYEEVYQGEYTLSLDSSNIRRQQEVSEDESNEVTASSQSNSLFSTDFLDHEFEYVDEEGKTVTKKGLDVKIAYYEKLEKVWSILLTELKKELNIKGDIDTSSPDYFAISEKLVEVAVNLGYKAQDVALLREISENGFDLPLMFHPSFGKIENLLTSIFRRAIIKKPFNGNSYVITSDIGFSDNFKFEGSKSSSATVFIKGFDGNLKPERIEDGKVKPAQVLIPFPFSSSGVRREDFISFDKETDTYYLDLNKVPSEVLEMYGFRIPFQGPSSSAYVEVVGFLPKGHNFIVAPHETVLKMGADLDLDKMFMYSQFVQKNKDAEKDEIITKVDRNYLNKLVEESAALYNEITSLSQDLEQNEQEVNKKQRKLEKLDAKIIELEVEVLRNEMLNMHLALLKNPTYSAKAQEVLGYGELHNSSGDSLADWAKELDSKKAVESTVSLMSSLGNNKLFISNMSGKAAIGAFANMSVFNALIQFVEARSGNKIKITRNIEIESNGEVVVFDSNRNSLGSKNTLYNYKGKKRTKAEVLRDFLSVAVDDGKLQALGPMQVNSATLPIVNALVQLGFDEDLIVLFKQPAVIELLEQAAKDNMSGAPVKYLADSIREKKNEYRKKYAAAANVEEKNVTDIVLVRNEAGEGIPTHKLKSMEFYRDLAEGKIKDQVEVLKEQHKILSFLEYALELGNELLKHQLNLNIDSKGTPNTLGALYKKFHGTKEENLADLTDSSLISIDSQIQPEGVKALYTTGSHKLSALEYGISAPYYFIRNLMGTDLTQSLGKKLFKITRGSDGAVSEDVLYNNLNRAFIKFINSGFPYYLGRKYGYTLTREMHQKLFIDTPTNTSVAKIIQIAKDTIKNNMFLNALQLSIQQEEKSYFKHNPKAINENETAKVIAFNQLLADDTTDLGTFNGIKFTPKVLADHIIMANYLEGGVQDSRSITKFIEMAYMMNSGFHVYAKQMMFKLNNNEDSLQESFLQQFLANNARMVKKAKFSAASDANEFKEDSPALYLSVYDDKVPGKYRLYQRTNVQKDDKNQLVDKTGIYVRIPTLGTGTTSEYNIYAALAGSRISSIFPANNSKSKVDIDDIQEKTMSKILDSIVEEYADISNMANKTLVANIIKNSRELFELDKIEIEYVEKGDFRGKITENGKKILINKKQIRNNSELSSVILEEVLHAVTQGISRELALEINTGNSLFNKLKEANRKEKVNALKESYKEIHAIYKQLKEIVTDSSPTNSLKKAYDKLQKDVAEGQAIEQEDLWLYHFTNIDEFIHGMLTNPDLHTKINLWASSTEFKERLPQLKEVTFTDKVLKFFVRILEALGINSDSYTSGIINSLMNLQSSLWEATNNIAKESAVSASIKEDVKVAQGENLGRVRNTNVLSETTPVIVVNTKGIHSSEFAKEAQNKGFILHNATGEYLDKVGMIIFPVSTSKDNEIDLELLKDSADKLVDSAKRRNRQYTIPLYGLKITDENKDKVIPILSSILERTNNVSFAYNSTVDTRIVAALKEKEIELEIEKQKQQQEEEEEATDFTEIFKSSEEQVTQTTEQKKTLSPIVDTKSSIKNEVIDALINDENFVSLLESISDKEAEEMLLKCGV